MSYSCSKVSCRKRTRLSYNCHITRLSEKSKTLVKRQLVSTYSEVGRYSVVTRQLWSSNKCDETWISMQVEIANIIIQAFSSFRLLRNSKFILFIKYLVWTIQSLGVTLSNLHAIYIISYRNRCHSWLSFSSFANYFLIESVFNVIQD